MHEIRGTCNILTWVALACSYHPFPSPLLSLGSPSCMIDIAMGLEHCHAKGVVLCDLKPANVILCHDGSRFVAKVSDFGLACGKCGKGHDSSLQHGHAMRRRRMIVACTARRATSISAEVLQIAWYCSLPRPPGHSVCRLTVTVEIDNA